MRTHAIISLSLILLVKCQAVCANDATATRSLENSQIGQVDLSIAIGFGGITNPLQGANNIQTPVLPHLSYYSESFYFDDFSMGYSLYEDETWYVDLASTFNSDGFFFELDGVDKLFVASPLKEQIPNRPPIMGEAPPADTPREQPQLNSINRRLSYLGGVVTGVHLNLLNIEASYLQDVSAVHHGHEASLVLWRAFDITRQQQLLFEVGATYKSADVIDYYYTLRPDEAPMNARAYELGGSAINWHVKLGYAYYINRDWSIQGSIRHTQLDSTLAKAPVFDTDYYSSGFFGLTYHF